MPWQGYLAANGTSTGGMYRDGFHLWIACWVKNVIINSRQGLCKWRLILP